MVSSRSKNNDEYYNKYTRELLQKYDEQSGGGGDDNIDYAYKISKYETLINDLINKQQDLVGGGCAEIENSKSIDYDYKIKKYEYLIKDAIDRKRGEEVLGGAGDDSIDYDYKIKKYEHLITDLIAERRAAAAATTSTIIGGGNKNDDYQHKIDKYNYYLNNFVNINDVVLGGPSSPLSAALKSTNREKQLSRNRNLDFIDETKIKSYH